MISGVGTAPVVGTLAGGKKGVGAVAGCPGAVAANGANVSGDGLFGCVTCALGDAVGDGSPGRPMGSGTSIGR